MFCSVLLNYFINKNLQYINVHAYKVSVMKANPKKGTKARTIINIPKLNRSWPTMARKARLRSQANAILRLENTPTQ